MDFMLDCAARIKGRVQITTDGHKAYLEAVEEAFGADVDYAQLQKIYGAPSDEETRRYSPARCIGCELKVSERRSRSQAREHVLCRTAQPHDEDEHEALHQIDQRLFQENPESRSYGCDPCRALQFRQNPQDAQNYT